MTTVIITKAKTYQFPKAGGRRTAGMGKTYGVHVNDHLVSTHDTLKDASMAARSVANAHGLETFSLAWKDPVSPGSGGSPSV